MIITQDLCNVCSVDLALVEQTCKDLPQRPKIVSLDPFTIEEVMADIVRSAKQLIVSFMLTSPLPAHLCT